MTTERFVLEIECKPDGSGAPAVVRLRGFLKRLLRSYGFRCISVESVDNDKDKAK